MNILLTGIIILIGVHLLPSNQALRNRLVAILGLWPYKFFFAVIALTGLALIVIGKAEAELIILWETTEWSRIISLSLMPVSFILIVAAYLPSNIKRLTPHPMLWGVFLWALLHLASNGDVASIILFAAIGAYALFDIWSANVRGAKKSGILQSLVKDIIVVVVGMIIYTVALIFHKSISGISIFY